MIKIIIPGKPITKKNNGRIIVNPKTKKPIILPSKQYTEYEKYCEEFLEKFKGLKIDKPINIKALYYMPTHHKVDITNLMNATHDILVKYEVIKDDNSSIVVGVDGSRVLYNRYDPRVEITIEEIDENYYDGCQC